MKLFKKILSMAVAVLPLAANAQANVDIKFETQDYKSVGVYDWWEGSPFREQNGQPAQLKGNCRVIANPFADEPDAANVSARVLALQRSRFGSNLFGARIDLNEDQRFELNNQFQYVHVLIRKPVAGRSMVIGLGRHNENTPGYADVWADQKEDVVQFTALGNNKAAADKWTDVVFPIKGAGNITIYSLVVVVDCEAPTDLTEDFACFVDNVKVNGSKKPENAVVGDYPACFDNEQEYTRTDRKLNSVTVKTAAGTYTKKAVGNHCRNEVFDGYISAAPGEKVTVQCDYKGSWMHSFFYLDKNQDGKFNATDELVTYRNSDQNDFKAQQTFTIPEDLAPGIYRLRAKVDWESTDPAGNPGDAQGKNYIIDNGGGMIDVLFNVYNPEEPQVNVSDNQRNGYVFLPDGSKLDDYKHDRLTELTVLPQGADGFYCDGLIVRHGYNVGVVADSLQHSNPQYLAYEIKRSQFNEDGTCTIPAAVIDADVIIEGIMISGTAPDGPDEPVVDPTATFPYVSPAPVGGQWVKGTKAYYIQNGAKEGAWLSLDNAREDGLRLDANETPEEDPRGEWVVCGNDELGYSFYNVSAGAEYVLGLVGDDKYARVNLVKVGEEGGATTRFDFHENGDGFSFRLHGSEYNCLNSRDQYLALWSAAAAFATDNGSRFTFFFAEDVEGVDLTPDYNTTDKFFTAEMLRAEVAKNGKAPIGILNVTTTGNKYVNGLSCTEVASADGTLDGVRAPFDQEVVEVIAVEGGYVLRLASADEGDGYFDCAAGGNLSICGLEGALVWQIVGHDEEGYGDVTSFDDLYYDIDHEVNAQMVRFIAHGQYLNGQGTNSASGLRGGKGAWSFNYVYNVNYAGGESVGVHTVLAPEVSDAIYNLSGQRMNRPVKGINIVAGRKVLR